MSNGVKVWLKKNPLQKWTQDIKQVGMYKYQNKTKQKNSYDIWIPYDLITALRVSLLIKIIIVVNKIGGKITECWLVNEESIFS